MACTRDASGGIVKEVRIDSAPEAYPGYFGALSETSRGGMEGPWGWLLDVPQELERLGEVVLTGPGRTRISADPQISTDKLDRGARCRAGSLSHETAHSATTKPYRHSGKPGGSDNVGPEFNRCKAISAATAALRGAVLLGHRSGGRTPVHISITVINEMYKYLYLRISTYKGSFARERPIATTT